jgi:hypothetical protein
LFWKSGANSVISFSDTSNFLSPLFELLHRIFFGPLAALANETYEKSRPILELDPANIVNTLLADSFTVLFCFPLWNSKKSSVKAESQTQNLETNDYSPIFKIFKLSENFKFSILKRRIDSSQLRTPIVNTPSLSHGTIPLTRQKRKLGWESFKKRSNLIKFSSIILIITV